MGRWLEMRIDWVAAMVLVLASFSVPLLPDFVSDSVVGVMLTQGMVVTGMLEFGVRQCAEVIALMVSVERVNAFSDLPPEEADAVGAAGSAKALAAAALPAGWPAHGQLEFRDAVMSYAKQDSSGKTLTERAIALNGCSFACRPREKVWCGAGLRDVGSAQRF